MEWSDVIYVKWFYFEVKWSEVEWVKWSGVKCSDVEWTMWSDFILKLSEVKWVKWSGVKCSDVEWTMWSGFILKLSEVSYGEVLEDRITTHFRVTLLWLLQLVCVLYCGCFNLFCNVWVCVCVGFVMCESFGNMYSCIYCVLNCFVFVYLFLFVLSLLA